MSEANHEKGTMNISQNTTMWDDFVSMTKWSTGLCIAIVVLLALFVA